jgi:hypothetical protein
VISPTITLRERFHDPPILVASRDIRLVGDHHEPIAGGFQPAERLFHVRKNLHRVERRRRVRLAAAHNRLVQHAVPIEKDGFHFSIV